MKTLPLTISLFILTLLGAGAYYWFSTHQPAPEPTQPQYVSGVVYLVKVGDGAVTDTETFGCGDVLIGTEVRYLKNLGTIHGTIQSLLDNHQETNGTDQLRNALWQSTLQLDSVSTKDGVMTIALSGSVMLGGECDGPRFVEQLQATANQAAGKDTVITINNQPLATFQNLKG